MCDICEGPAVIRETTDGDYVSEASDVYIPSIDGYVCVCSARCREAALDAYGVEV